jgi:hypothetical protein
MANTERFLTLQRVVEARKSIGTARLSPDLTRAQSKMLDDAFGVLMDIEDTLILAELKDSIEQLEAKVDELTPIIKRMKSSIDTLKSIADLIQKAAVAVGALADIVSKASSAGIL